MNKNQKGPACPALPAGGRQAGFAPILILLLVVVILGLAVFAYLSYQKQLRYQKVDSAPYENTVYSSPVSTPATSESELIDFIRNEFDLPEEATITVMSTEGVYAWGNAGVGDEGGFYWAAAKVNGEWSYSTQGNGIPDCKDVEIFPVGTFKNAAGEGKFDMCYEGSELKDRSI